MASWILTVDFEVEADSRIEAVDKLRDVLDDTDAELEVNEDVDRELFRELGVDYD